LSLSVISRLKASSCAAPFFVFRDPLAEQGFLLARQTRRAPSLAPLAARRRSKQARIEALRPELDALLVAAQGLGRWPAAEELPLETVARLSAAEGSLAAAVRLAQTLARPEVLSAAAEQRRRDLCVYFALNIFNGRTRYRSLPSRLQRDVKAFFRDYSAAQQAGRALLFSIGKTEALAIEALKAAEAGLGFLDENGGYWIRPERLPHLPAALRCFAGCAERFAGGLDEADLAKFHLSSGKLTAFRYVHFEGSALPRLATRTKVDLRAQRVRDFDHRDQDQRLLFKSRYMTPDESGYARQAAFDREAHVVGLGSLGVRATGAEILRLAAATGWTGPNWAWASKTLSPV
jgi:DNA phosphorothioation-associated putative methyltransferase